MGATGAGAGGGCLGVVDGNGRRSTLFELKFSGEYVSSPFRSFLRISSSSLVTAMTLSFLLVFELVWVEILVLSQGGLFWLRWD